MNTLKQPQQQEINKVADTETPYEWSLIRVAEGVTINVVSALLVALGAVLLGAIYGAWVLLLTLWHIPGGIIASLAFVLLGGVLAIIILLIVFIAWLRGIKSATLAGMLMGALIGAAIGAAMDTEKGKLEEILAKAQKQTTATHANSEKPK